MSATEETRNFGECFVLANVRMRGEQPVEIRGVAGAAARASETSILVRVGRY